MLCTEFCKSVSVDGLGSLYVSGAKAEPPYRDEVDGEGVQAGDVQDGTNPARAERSSMGSTNSNEG